MDSATIYLLHPSLRKHSRIGGWEDGKKHLTMKFCETTSFRNVREGTSINSQQHYSLKKISTWVAQTGMLIEKRGNLMGSQPWTKHYSQLKNAGIGKSFSIGYTMHDTFI